MAQGQAILGNRARVETIRTGPAPVYWIYDNGAEVISPACGGNNQLYGAIAETSRELSLSYRLPGGWTSFIVVWVGRDVVG